MSRVLVIGCGGVASVAIHKICQVSEVFSDLCIASRTVSKCDKLADELKGKTSTNITTAKVDADNTDEVIALINEFKPDVVLNVALPYQDLTIMDACLACKVPYVDTANYECEDTDNPEWRKVYEERCKRLGFTSTHSASLIRGIAEGFRAVGKQIGGFDAYTASEVLRGSGLSSSAAFEMGMASIWNEEYSIVS